MCLPLLSLISVQQLHKEEVSGLKLIIAEQNYRIRCLQDDMQSLKDTHEEELAKLQAVMRTALMDLEKKNAQIQSLVSTRLYFCVFYMHIEGAVGSGRGAEADGDR